MRVGLLVLALLVSGPALAQPAHPCDAPAQLQPTKGNRLGWCHDLKDTDGDTVAAESIWFLVSINGAVSNTGPLIPAKNPSASGRYYFEVGLPKYPRGLYPIFVVAASAEGEAPPSNTVVWQVGGPPNAATAPTIASLMHRLLAPVLDY